MSYKTFNGLMKHIRDVNHISTHESKTKQQLMNMGYFHGYKGYRFFKTNKNILPFTDFSEINETFILDCKLKSIFYEKLMFIETALKSRVLSILMSEINSSDLNDLYDEALENYHSCPSNMPIESKKRIQSKNLKLKASINNKVQEAYKNDNPKICHYYENNNLANQLPLWAVFELFTFGLFGEVVKCLKFCYKQKISKGLLIPQQFDSDAKILQGSLFLLKDLRNTVAHNEICYDCRFHQDNQYSAQVSKNMKNLLCSEFKLSFADFKDIVDYVALMSLFLKILGISKTERKKFVASVLEAFNDYDTKIADNKIKAVTLRRGVIARLKQIYNNT